MKNAAIATDQVRPRPLVSITWEIAIALPAITAIGASTRFGAYAENANAAAQIAAPRAITETVIRSAPPGSIRPMLTPATSATARPPLTPAMMPAVASSASVIRALPVT